MLNLYFEKGSKSEMFLKTLQGLNLVATSQLLRLRHSLAISLNLMEKQRDRETGCWGRQDINLLNGIAKTREIFIQTLAKTFKNIVLIY